MTKFKRIQNGQILFRFMKPSFFKTNGNIDEAEKKFIVRTEY